MKQFLIEDKKEHTVKYKSKVSCAFCGTDIKMFPLKSAEEGFPVVEYIHGYKNNCELNGTTIVIHIEFADEICKE